MKIEEISGIYIYIYRERERERERENVIRGRKITLPSTL